MNRILRKDPIVEARCEFRFDSPDWDWTVPGLLWGQIRDEFPLKQQFELVPSDAPEDTKEILGVSQLNFWRQDKSALVRIEPNELSIIQRAPYTGWPQFRATIERVLNTYKEVASPGSLESIELRYINHVPLPPEDEFDVRDYVSVHPTIPSLGGIKLGAWMQQAQLLEKEKQLGLFFKAGFVSISDKEELIMVVDITAKDFMEPILNGREIQRLDTAHEQIEDLFFACFKPKYLALLQLEEIEDEN